MAAPPRKYSPEDGRRLTMLYKVDRCLFTLADQLEQPIHEILTWASLPHIKEAIELIERNEFAGVRAIVIQTLRKVIDKTTDPVELRRAACALLRALSSPPRRTTSPPLPKPSPPAPSPPDSRAQPDRPAPPPPPPAPRSMREARKAREAQRQPHARASINPSVSKGQQPTAPTSIPEPAPATPFKHAFTPARTPAARLTTRAGTTPSHPRAPPRPFVTPSAMPARSVCGPAACAPR